MISRSGARAGGRPLQHRPGPGGQDSL